MWGEKRSAFPHAALAIEFTRTLLEDQDERTQRSGRRFGPPKSRVMIATSAPIKAREEDLGGRDLDEIFLHDPDRGIKDKAGHSERAAESQD